MISWSYGRLRDPFRELHNADGPTPPCTREGVDNPNAL